MQRFITDERTSIQYELIGDYYYPCLMMEEPPTLSKYGRMRERYLREHRKAFYFTLLASGKLNEHLIQIDTSACNMAEHLNTVFQEICKHEVLEDCSADKSSILENHKKSS